MENKYKALRSLIWLFRILAGLVFLSGVVYGGINSLLGIIALGAITAILLYALGELLNLFVDIEENTRRTYLLLERLPRSTGAKKLPLKDSEDEPSISSIVQKNR